MTLLAGQHRVQFGDSVIEYELTFSERKTLAIHVHPDGSVVVDAPLDTSPSAAEQKVLKRAAWILRQQRQFGQYPSAVSLPRRYVSGESYRYLGRQYRLKVVEGQVEHVRLSRGYLTVTVADTTNKRRIAQLLDDWYRGHARRVFEERLVACFPRVQPYGIPYPELQIRRMKNRWGSCTASRKIILNAKLIQAPKDLIDYVILHELCHLKEHNHGASFYWLIDRVLPGWQSKRRSLNTLDMP